MKLTTLRSLRTIQANDSTATIALPAITDAASIQRAIAAVLHAVAAGTLEAPRARVLLYGLQIAATNARRIAAEKGSEAEAASAPVAEALAPAKTSRETPQAYAADEAATSEAIEEQEEQQEHPAHADHTIASDAPEAPQPEDAAQPQTSASFTEALKEAATPVTGYIGSARSRMLAFRNKSATS
jgi:hypothetical protein